MRGERRHQESAQRKHCESCSSEERKETGENSFTIPKNDPTFLTFPESQLIPKRLSLSTAHMAFAPPTSPHAIGPAQGVSSEGSIHQKSKYLAVNTRHLMGFIWFNLKSNHQKMQIYLKVMLIKDLIQFKSELSGSHVTIQLLIRNYLPFLTIWFNPISKTCSYNAFFLDFRETTLTQTLCIFFRTADVWQSDSW